MGRLALFAPRAAEKGWRLGQASSKNLKEALVREKYDKLLLYCENKISEAEMGRDSIARYRAMTEIRTALDALELSERPSWSDFTEGYEAPSPEEICEAFSPFTAQDLADILGVVNIRTIRKWRSGESTIPYSSWRLFLILTGRVKATHLTAERPK